RDLLWDRGPRPTRSIRVGLVQWAGMAVAFPTSDMAGHKVLRARIDDAVDRPMEAANVDFMRSASWTALKWTIVRRSSEWQTCGMVGSSSLASLRLESYGGSARTRSRQPHPPTPASDAGTARREGWASRPREASVRVSRGRR